MRQQGRNFKHTVNLERLRFKNPNAKIIVTIREQKRFLESRYKHGIVRGNISSNFEDWLISEEGLDFLSLCDYNNLYSIIRTFFKSENIRFFLYEDLNNDYNKYYREIFQFIGLSIPDNLSNEKKMSEHIQVILSKIN